MKTTSILAIALLHTCAAFAQLTTTNTTLSAAIAANTTGQWCVASATGIVVPSATINGSYLSADKEVVQVTAAGTLSTCFKVKRGQLGTSANAAHAISSVVYAGGAAVSSGDPSRPFAGGPFVTVAPSGYCLSTSQYTLPLIATGGATGRGTLLIVNCTGSQWVYSDSQNTATGVYIAAGTAQAGAHIVFGKCTLGTSCAVTFAGSSAWTSGTSYQCSGTDQTSAAAVKVVNTSSTVATFTGTSTDVISYVCMGN